MALKNNPYKPSITPVNRVGTKPDFRARDYGTASTRNTQCYSYTRLIYAFLITSS